jgi:DNA-binding transcriptional MocR family regulator
LTLDGVNIYIVTVTMWVPRIEGRGVARYLSIVESLAEDVAAGVLKPGTRLPTHRDLADRLGVTVGTVSRAYAEASRRGLISGEVGRGTFIRARPITDPRVPYPEPGLINLSQNHPPHLDGGPHRLAIEKTLLALVRQEDLARVLDYPADGGNAADREAGASWIGRSGLAARPEDVLVCSGSQHGIVTVLATIMKPGDVLLTDELTYPGLKSVAGLLHLRLQGVAFDEEGMRPEAFEEACRGSSARAVYLVPTIHNPTAYVMPEGRRREIARIARAHGVAIVEDDIHALLAERRPAPVASFAPEIGYYLSSTSKTLAPGLRISFVLGPAGMFERLASSLRATTWAAPPLMAALASAWIRDGTADALVADRRREAVARQARARALLGGARYEAHPSGYYVWLHLPAPWRSDTFTAEMRARGVAVTPAEAFVVGRGTVPHAVRLCLGAARDRAELERGLVAVAEALPAAREAGAAIV